MIALASGAAQADAPTPSAALPGSGLLHNLFTPLAGANLGLSLDVPGTRVDAGLLPDGPLALVPNDGRVGVTAHTLTKNGMPQDVFFTGKLPDVLKIVPVDGLLPPGVVGPVLNAGAGALGNVSNTVADTTRTVSGFNTPAMGVHMLTADAARTLVGESAPVTSEEGLPIVGPLLGSLPIVGGLLGNGGPLSSLPIVGGLLGGDSGSDAGGGGLPSVGSLPVVGGLAQSLPIVGNLAGGESAPVTPATADEEGLPIVGPLLGGLPLVGGLLGDNGPLSSLPIVGGLLGGGGGGGGGLPSVGSLPFVGGLTQSLPAMGGGLTGGESASVTSTESAPVGSTEGLPIVGPLLGSLPVVGGLLGDGGPLGSLPIVGGLLGGGGSSALPTVGSLPVVGGVTDAVGTSIPQASMTASDTVDDLVTPLNEKAATTEGIATTEGLPIIGSLLGKLPIVGGLLGNLPIVGGLLTDSGVPGGVPNADFTQGVPAQPASNVAPQGPARPATTPSRGRHAAPEMPASHPFGNPAATGQRPVVGANGTTLGDPTTEGLPLVGSLPLVGPLLDGATGGGLPLVGSVPLVGPLLGGDGGAGSLINSLPVPLTLVQSLPVVGALVP